ncbi:MAG TPA: phosphoenolpyruvate--protein phosphotransferase, partial [Candidatus Limnocylindrales bacterium]
IGAAAGIAIGPVWIYEPPVAPQGEPAAAAEDPSRALERLAAEAARELEALGDRLRAIGRSEEADIFDAQAMMATDDTLLDAIVARARDGMPLPDAIAAAAAAAAEEIGAIDDPILAARAADVRDVGARMCRILTGTSVEMPKVPSIIVGGDLPPSIVAEIPPGLALGFALESGSRTAHVVILSRSLGLPAVVGATDLCARAHEAIGTAGASVLCALDGETGAVYLGLDEALEQSLRDRDAALAAARAEAAQLRSRPGATADGRRIMLVANIGKPEDSERALEMGAEGVGLLRTEFMFLSRSSAPTESEQVAAYRRVMSAFGPERPVVIRLADIGGDKPVPYLHLPDEENPFLGVRAIRLAYSSRDLLQTQLRAIWRAGALADVVPHVMAPMIATLSDVELLASLRDQAREEVIAAGHPCAAEMVTGIMIEVPSAAFIAPELARRVGFLSIGTNDLTQYIFAADRGSAPLASMQDPLHPAVLRAIALITAAGRDNGIPVAVCGEAAGDIAAACVLVGLGVTELSADAALLDGLRSTLARYGSSELEALAHRALACDDAASVRALAASLFESSPPSVVRIGEK